MWPLPLLSNVQLVKVAGVEFPVVATVGWMHMTNVYLTQQFLKSVSRQVEQFLGARVGIIWCPSVVASLFMVNACWIDSMFLNHCCYSLWRLNRYVYCWYNLLPSVHPLWFSLWCQDKMSEQEIELYADRPAQCRCKLVTTNRTGNIRPKKLLILYQVHMLQKI